MLRDFSVLRPPRSAVRAALRVLPRAVLRVLLLAAVLAGSSAMPALADARAAGAPPTLAELRAVGEQARGALGATVARLQAMREHTAPGSPERLELLTVLGLVLGDAQRAEAAHAVRAELDAWAAQSRDPAARVAALTVGANVDLLAGEPLRAERQLREALAASAAPPDSIERTLTGKARRVIDRRPK